MEPRENAEEIPVLCRRVRHPRIAQQQGEDGAERRPQDHGGEDGRDPGAIDPFHEDRDHKVRVRMRLRRNEIPPRHHADDGQVYRHVDQRHRDCAEQDRAWNDATGVLDFIADVADVVIAEVIVDADA